MNTRDPGTVVVVDPDGTSVGALGVEAAHRAPGRLHLAVSVQLVDGDGRWLLQRRASTKAAFAGRWANSCCTHPAPGEAFDVCAARRVTEELGVRPVDLRPAGCFRYRAVDPVSGLVEHELDHVFVGRLAPDAVLRPDPAEISEVAAVGYERARALAGTGPLAAPWAATVLDLARSARHADAVETAGTPAPAAAP